MPPACGIVCEFNETQSMSIRVAVVLSGWHRVRLVDSGHNVRQNLVQPLGADVLLHMTYRWDDGCNSTASCGLHKSLAGIWPVVTRFALEPMPTIFELVQTLEQLSHWPAILRAFNRTRHVQGNPLYGVPGPWALYPNHRTALYNTCVRDPTWSLSSDLAFNQRTSARHIRVARMAPYRCDGLPTGVSDAVTSSHM